MTNAPALGDVVVVIPALNPAPRLIRLVDQLTGLGFERFVVVNDGSGSEATPVFEALGRHPRVVILTHAANAGKGRALKTAFEHVLRSGGGVRGVITVDADGQHAPEDVRRVAESLLREPDGLVLGARSFGPGVPLRNRVGNLLSRHVFRVVLGRRFADTQTGLRGIPSHFLPALLDLREDRYDYETRMLVATVEDARRVREVRVATIYGEAARGSHFRPFLDSMRVYFVLARFAASSLLASLVDLVGFMALYTSDGSVPLSLAAGRACSVSLNFAVNRRVVFKTDAPLGWSLAKYLALVVALGTASLQLIVTLHERLGLAVPAAKIVAETTLFVFSFWAQRELVFRRPPGAARADADPRV